MGDLKMGNKEDAPTYFFRYRLCALYRSNILYITPLKLLTFPCYLNSFSFFNHFLHKEIARYSYFLVLFCFYNNEKNTNIT